MYRVELVWNREFNFVPFGLEYDDLDVAIQYAQAMEESGDGARVKKTRIVNGDGQVVWEYGEKVKLSSDVFEKRGVQVSKEAFERFVEIQKSGIVNMMDRRAACLAEISEAEHNAILKYYEKLEEFYCS